jgi:spore coat polysaccharide biosynthesis protein SpsF
LTTTCVVQARTGSSRLPGKVLLDLAGRPMLAFMLERLAVLEVDRLVVATSDAPSDAPIEQLCRGLGVPCFRGAETDVLSRFVGAISAFPADHTIRLTADCPLIDPAVVRLVLDSHRAIGADYTSNTLLRTYPDGMDVEVIRTPVLFQAGELSTDPVEREHVTPWIYRHPEWHVLAAHRGDDDAGDERWTVDTAADMEQLRAMVAAVPAATTAPWTSFLTIWGRHRSPAPGGLRLRPASASDADRILAWRNDPVTVRYSRSGRAVTDIEHRAWFELRLDRPATRIWIGEVNGSAVGQVRIDVDAAVGEVDVVIDPANRGRGYGSLMIDALLRQLGADYQVVRLTATVHPENTASRKAFERAGFRLASVGEFLEFGWER